MENFRFKALEMALTRKVIKNGEANPRKISEYFGEMTFNRSTMREYLTQEA